MFSNVGIALGRGYFWGGGTGALWTLSIWVFRIELVLFYLFLCLSVDRLHWLDSFSLIKQGDEYDEKLKEAYQSLLTIRLYEPKTPDYVKFQKEMNLRMMRDYNYVPDAGNEVSAQNVSLIIRECWN